MAHFSLAPFVISIDDSDRPEDVLDALALEAFASGAQPWAKGIHLADARADAPLVPPDAGSYRKAIGQWRTVYLSFGDGWTCHAQAWDSGGAHVCVTATSEELAAKVADALASGIRVTAEPDSNRLLVGFWSTGPHGPRRVARQVEVVPWSEARANYSKAPAAALDDLMAVSPEALNGRLMLLHGPAGTGKTSILRSLGHAWRSWCRVDYVLDPERLFGDPYYLNAAVLGGDDNDDDEGRWRLLVLEDCDELIRAGAKSGAGQALSRLLNLTDGLLGQGTQVLVCLTTNEELSRLHPAVIRPGRCLAQIHVGPLTGPEAVGWLEARGVTGGEARPATLAELFARLRGEAPFVVVADSPPYGQYL